MRFLTHANSTRHAHVSDEGQEPATRRQTKKQKMTGTVADCCALVSLQFRSDTFPTP